MKLVCFGDRHLDHIGNKLLNERVSILFCVNREGDKLPPLIIGKSKNPRCFNSYDFGNRNIRYTNQQNAWMDRNTFYWGLVDWHKQL